MYVLTFPDAVPPATPIKNGAVDNSLDIIPLLLISPMSLLLPRARLRARVHCNRKMLNSSFRMITRWIRSYSGVEYRCTDTGVKEEVTNQLLVRVAVIGLPNCGKSTLVNQLMRQKVNCLNVCMCARDAGLL